MARKVKRPAPTYGALSATDGGPSASDPYEYRQDKGIYGPKPKRPKRHPVPMPQYQPRRKGVRA